MTQRTRIALSGVATGLAILAAFTGACDGNPSTPSRSTTPANRVVPTPTVTSVSQNVRSTGGDTPIVIAGSGFLLGVTATRMGWSTATF